MKITHKNQSIHLVKPGGLEVNYYLFDEYEIHLNVQPPHSGQDWHYHQKIHETVIILEGEMTAFWEEGGETKSEKLEAGDLVETENTNHTFKNESDQPAKILVIKQILSGEDKRETFKTDKVTTIKE